MPTPTTPVRRPDNWNESGTVPGDRVVLTNAEMATGFPLSAIRPDRQTFNGLLNEITNAIRYLLRRGVPDWSSAETYLIGDRVIGSNNSIYVSLTNSNTNNDPTTSATHWRLEGNDLPTNSVSDAELRQSAGTSVMGRSANTTGNVADIAATADGQILRRISGVLEWNNSSTLTIEPASQIAGVNLDPQGILEVYRDDMTGAGRVDLKRLRASDYDIRLTYHPTSDALHVINPTGSVLMEILKSGANFATLGGWNRKSGSAVSSLEHDTFTTSQTHTLPAKSGKVMIGGTASQSGTITVPLSNSISTIITSPLKTVRAGTVLFVAGYAKLTRTGSTGPVYLLITRVTASSASGSFLNAQPEYLQTVGINDQFVASLSGLYLVTTGGVISFELVGNVTTGGANGTVRISLYDMA